MSCINCKNPSKIENPHWKLLIFTKILDKLKKNKIKNIKIDKEKA